MTDQYAVIGNPVAHSKSPLIHASFARQTGQDLQYTTLLAELDQFQTTVARFFAEGGRGLNVTVPFKQQAFALADACSPQATLAGAVNTLVLDPSGVLYGHNTDGIGLVRDIVHNLGQGLRDKSVLVLGAGGASRGILQPLLEQKPGSLLIANRTQSKAEELGAIFSALGPVQACGFEQVPEQPFDWVINATAASLQGELPAVSVNILGARTCCYDLMYGAQPTAFLQWGQQHGAALLADGLGMLVEQAAESFWLWRKVRPETNLVIQELRRQLALS